MNPGAGLRITTGAGSFTTVRGCGGPGRPMDIRATGRCGRRRMCPSSVSGEEWASEFGFGSVGWLPIGPCDTFYPWYGRYRSRYNVVNVTNINDYNNRGFGGIAPLRPGGAYSNVRLASMNDRVRGGISTVPTGQFGTGRSAAGRSEPRSLSQRAHDCGKSSGGSDAGGLVGEQPSGSGIHDTARRRCSSASSRNRGRRPHRDRSTTRCRRCGSRSSVARRKCIREGQRAQPELRERHRARFSCTACAGSSD